MKIGRLHVSLRRFRVRVMRRPRVIAMYRAVCAARIAKLQWMPPYHYHR
jgi:hypothetical protein